MELAKVVIKKQTSSSTMYEFFQFVHGVNKADLF